VPSVRRAPPARLLGTTAVLLVTAGLLAGCTTTQHEAQRMQIDSARERAAVLSTKVTAANPLVRASVSATVAQGGHTALVVSVRNVGRKPVTDLPISVGYSLPGKPRVYLNAAEGLEYFQSHLPALFPGKPRVWVYTAARLLPKGAQLFATVGDKPSVPALLNEPDLNVALKLDGVSGNRLRIGLQNSTSVPQYQLQVYAYARRDGHYVAAGNKTVVDLGAGSHQNLTLKLVGAAQGATVQVEAIPTILQ
jgi:hypothetical protein